MTTNEVLWVSSRATGIVSIVLLTTVLLLGVFISGTRAGSAPTRATTVALHRWLGLGITTFLVLHIVTAIAETFVDITWWALILPFSSGFMPLWVGLGTLALDLLVAVALTSLLRERLPDRLWRAVHLGAYALWPLGIVHGIALGTGLDALRWTTIACAVVGSGALTWRLLVPSPDAEKRRSISQGAWS